LAVGAGATHFVALLPSAVDLSGATITAKVYAPGATAGVIQAYVQQNALTYTQLLLGERNLIGTSSWTTFSWTVATPEFASGPRAGRIGLSVETGGATGPFQQPETIIYVSQITATLPDASAYVFDFDTPSTVDATMNFPSDAGELWLNKDDPHLPGSSLAYDSVCGQPVPMPGSDAGDGATTAEANNEASVEDGEDAKDAAAVDATSETGSDAQTAVCPPGLGDAGTGGCAVLTVPLSGAYQTQWYMILLPGPTDFTGATITMQYIAPGATGGVIQPFL
jgi:hypothetical protein